jgi:hypothetical protein
MRKICPRCSSRFVCREDRTELCHCSHIIVISEVKEYIKESYESCLCPKCLKETSNNFHSFGVNPKYLVKSTANQ